MADKMRVNYIKASFRTLPPNLDIIDRYFTKKRGLRIASFPDLSTRIKVSVMGNNCEYVNLTGGKTMIELECFADSYCDIVKTEIVSQIKVDSIAATTHLDKLRDNCSFELRKRLADAGFTIKDNQRFPGCVLRNNRISEKGVCIYFRTSGALNFCGFKKQEDIQQMCNAVSDAI